MKVPQDARFREQAEAFTLRWNCEDCVLYAGGSDCAHGYPTMRHRRARYEDPAADLYFCKDFDLA